MANRSVGLQMVSKLVKIVFKSGEKRWILKEVAQDREKKSSGAFLKGNEEGKFIEWYENGEKYREQNYIEGKRHGLKI